MNLFLPQKRTSKNTSGFSLVELMIVVAIFGLMAAIGIPQYAKSQAKARQSEAKASLSGLFAALRTFKYEWDSYTNNLNNLAFGVEGRNLRYIAGFLSGVACVNSVASGYLGPPEIATGENDTWTSNIVGGGPLANSTNGIWMVGLIFTNHNSATGTVCNQTSFTAMAVGEPKNRGSIVTIDLSVASEGDRWTINESKTLANVHPGIN